MKLELNQTQALHVNRHSHQLAKCYALAGNKKHLQVCGIRSIFCNQNEGSLTNSVKSPGGCFQWQLPGGQRPARGRATRTAERAAVLGPVEPPQHGPRSHSAPPGASLPINSEHSQQREGLTNATVPCTSILTEQARGRVSNERQSPRCARHHADWQQQQRQPGSTRSGFIGLHTSVLRKFQVTNGDHCACGSHTFPHIHKW